ncbi:MAG TPA: pyruvate dehydrogenase complex dihydrolipoamide acetyltransferase [Bacteroidota bacterium]|nr:pyruvate dehydrogenase complex dihydrolipoamide acetyltransferase [Bacteroidota bacterium]
MATKIAMPKLSDTMEEGIILKWLKKEGDPVKQGEIIAEVQTDKADMELEAYDTGVLRKIFIPEGKGAAVGKPIAIIGSASEDISALLVESPAPSAGHGAPASAPPPPKPAEEMHAAPSVASASPGGGDGRIKVSPLAKAIAAQNKIDLHAINGSGPMGRIVKKDLEASLSRLSGRPSRTYAPGTTKEFPVSLMRKTIAKRLVESKTTAPHFYVTYDVDMKRAIDFRNSLNTGGDVKVSFNDIIVKACAYALRNHPKVNSTFTPEKIIQHGAINVGVAVAIDDGLITPVIRNTDMKTLFEIAGESKELAAKAREKKLKPEEFSGGTFTVSNLGMLGVEEFAAIINPPEAAILAVGAITETPVAENGHVVVGNRMKLTLSCDHRVVDGAIGAEFMQEVKANLENPWKLVL